MALYLAALAEAHKPATLARRLSAIAGAHKAAGHESPTHSALVRRALDGIRRTEGTAPDAKAPITVADLQAIVREHLPAGVKGTRDRALLLMGFAGGFRRSELAGSDLEHVAFVGEGVVITLPRSKTDQEGAERLTDRVVALLVKHYVAALGRDPSTYSGHSLRAGFATAAARAGAHERDIQR